MERSFLSNLFYFNKSSWKFDRLSVTKMNISCHVFFFIILIIQSNCQSSQNAKFYYKTVIVLRTAILNIFEK